MVFGTLSGVKTGIYTLVDKVDARTLDDLFEKLHQLVRCVPPGAGRIGNNLFPVMAATWPRNVSPCRREREAPPRRRQ